MCALRMLICGRVVIKRAVISSDFRELIDPAALGAGAADEAIEMSDVGRGFIDVG